MKVRHNCEDGKLLLMWNDESRTYIAHYVNGECVLQTSFRDIFCAIAAYCTVAEKNFRKRDIMYDRLCEKALSEGYDENTGRVKNER